MWDQLGPAVVLCSDSHCKKGMFRNQMQVRRLAVFSRAEKLLGHLALAFCRSLLMHCEFKFSARMNYSPLKPKEEFSAQSFRLFSLALIVKGSAN